jgi:hypothetical protein
VPVSKEFTMSTSPVPPEPLREVRGRLAELRAVEVNGLPYIDGAEIRCVACHLGIGDDDLVQHDIYREAVPTEIDERLWQHYESGPWRGTVSHAGCGGEPTRAEA